MDELRTTSQGQAQEDVLNSLRKELKVTRICSIVVAVLLFCVIAGGVYIVNMVTPMVTAIQEMKPAIQKMEQIDVEMLNEKIAQLDIEGLNQLIQGMDAEEMMEALENINDIIEDLEEIQAGFQSFSDSISDSFTGWFGLGNSGGSSNSL